MQFLNDVAAVEQTVGKRPFAMLLKSIDTLDEHCAELSALTRFVGLGYRDVDGRERVAALAGPSGFVRADGPGTLVVKADGPELVPSSRVSTVLLVPGLGETLRINGRYLDRADDGYRIDVEEAFLHCAKCILRSELWQHAEPPAPVGLADEGPVAGGPLDTPAVRRQFARSPFVMVASRDRAGHADVSPKGDPAGFVKMLDGHTLAIPNRPGNRRTDTFHNIVEDGRAAVLAVVPGSTTVVEAIGTAELTDDVRLRGSMEVRGRTPDAALVVHVEAVECRDCPDMTTAGLWDPARHADLAALPPMSRVWRDHVKQNRRRGVAARLARGLLVPESVLAKGLEKDYLENLY